MYICKRTLLLPGCLKCVGVSGFLLFSLSLIFIPSSLPSSCCSFYHCSSPPPPPPLLGSLPGLAGLRPCGLEDDVRQYEQDLAKRLYQARVRASQGPSQAPSSSAAASSSSCSSFSAASQLRSASRPGATRARRNASWGCAGLLLALTLSLLQAQTGPNEHLQQCCDSAWIHLCCLASAHLFCSSPPSLPPLPSLFSPPPLSAAALFLHLGSHPLLGTNTLCQSCVSGG